MKQISNAILIALHNVRSRFFHTFLSIIGIVVGVAALVGTLSLIDGLEKFANEQISSSTSINSMVVRVETSRMVDGVSIQKEDYPRLNFDHYVAMRKEIPFQVNSIMQVEESGKVNTISEEPITVGTRINGIAITWNDSEGESPMEVKFGRTMEEADLLNKKAVCFINSTMAKKIGKDSIPENALGLKLLVKGRELEVVGISEKETEKFPALAYPISLLSEKEFEVIQPALIVQAQNVEEVNPIKSALETWAEKAFPGQGGDFKIMTNESRVAQAEKAFLIFRLVMGMIVGLSVLVGGIGVMNVMLISVNERTTEIGISKALGAKRRDIFVQFLSESITISSLGSGIGLVLGILATMVFVPIIKTLAKVPFEAHYTFNTLFVIGTIALLVGVVFGTYPAARASKLDPVEAMRRE